MFITQQNLLRVKLGPIFALAEFFFRPSFLVYLLGNASVNCNTVNNNSELPASMSPLCSLLRGTLVYLWRKWVTAIYILIKDSEKQQCVKSMKPHHLEIKQNPGHGTLQNIDYETKTM